LPATDARSRLIAYAGLIAAAAAWGGTWVLVRGMRDEFPPIAVAMWRWLAAGAILLPFAAHHVRADWHKYRGHWTATWILGAIGTVTFAAFGALGVQYTTAMNASLFNALTPVLCLAMSMAILGTRVNGRYVVAMLLGLAGMVVIAAQGSLSKLAAFEINVGDMLVFVASLSWAAYTVGLRWKPQDVNPLGFLLVVTVIGLVVWSPIYAIEIANGLAPEINARTALTALALGAFPSVLAYVSWNYAVPRVGAHVAGLFGNLVPVFGISSAIVFLGERPEMFHLVGIGCIVAGLYLISRHR